MRDMTCSKCGKNFVPAAKHLYRDEQNYYCSWTCYIHRNDQIRKESRKAVEMCFPNGTIIRRFTSVTNAAESMGFAYKNIQQACREEALYFGYLWRYKK